MGFWHEQSRPDRDNFVTVNYANIQTGLAYAFDIEANTQMFGLSYDVDSIMHYDNYAFSNNGQPTIVAKSGLKLLATYQKTDAQILSSLDVQAIRSFYSCNGVLSTLAATTAAPTTTTRSATTTTVNWFVFTIVNRLTYSLRLYWINYQGVRVLYATIAPGSSYTQSSWLTHKWVLTSDDARYNKQFTIGADSSFLVPNSTFIAS